MLDRLGRSAGITARGAATGLASIPLMATDLAAYPVNLASRLMGKGNVLPNYQETFQRGMSELGLPEPQGNVEKLQMAASTGVGGGMSGVGIGQQLAKSASPAVAGVGNILRSAPTSQVVAGGSGATSSEFARQQGAGQTGQIAAGLAGGLVPGIAAQRFLPQAMNPDFTPPMLPKSTMSRQVAEQTAKKADDSMFGQAKPLFDDVDASNLDRTSQYQKSVQILDDAGVELSKGQRSGVDATRAIETTLEKLPVMGRPLQNLADKTRLSFQKKLLQLAGNESGDALVTRESLERTGNALSKRYAQALKDKKVSIADDNFLDDLAALEAKHTDLVDSKTANKVRDIIGKFLEKATDEPYFTGEKYQAQRSLFARRAKGQAETADLYADLKNSLDAAFRRAAGDKGKLDSQFAQYKQLEDLYNRTGGATTSEGFVSPVGIARAASGKPGSTEWKDFTRAAATVLPDRLPQSGTAQRQLITNIATGNMAAVAPAWMYLDPVSASIAGGSMLGARGVAGQLARQPAMARPNQLNSLLLPMTQATGRE
jgi:hypothetical protein